VGDVARFLASIHAGHFPWCRFLRRCWRSRLSVGGKTGVELKSRQDLLGTFHQPPGVLADPNVLKTLPEREYRSGLFEAMSTA